jgi:hypothetical protein
VNPVSFSCSSYSVFFFFFFFFFFFSLVLKRALPYKGARRAISDRFFQLITFEFSKHLCSPALSPQLFQSLHNCRVRRPQIHCARAPGGWVAREVV